MLKPGEFYADRTAKTVFVATTAAAAPSAVSVIGMSAPLIEGAPNTTGLAFENVAFELGGGWQGANSPRGLPQYQAGYRPVAGLGDNFAAPGDCVMFPHVRPNVSSNCWRNIEPIPAAIYFPAGRSIHFHSCTFRRMGTAALWCGWL